MFYRGSFCREQDDIYHSENNRLLQGLLYRPFRHKSLIVLIDINEIGRVISECNASLCRRHLVTGNSSICSDVADGINHNSDVLHKWPRDVWSHSIQTKLKFSHLTTLQIHKNNNLRLEFDGENFIFFLQMVNGVNISTMHLKTIKVYFKEKNSSSIMILPCLEYARELWIGCAINESNLLESVQLEGARVITGVQSFASKYSLYFETGLKLLCHRRER